MHANRMSRRAFLRLVTATAGTAAFVTLACEPVEPQVTVLPPIAQILTPTPIMPRTPRPASPESSIMSIAGRNRRQLEWFAATQGFVFEQLQVEFDITAVEDDSVIFARIAAGIETDIILTDPILADGLLRGDALLPLDEFAGNADFDFSPYWPAARQAFTSNRDGGLYALPVSGSYGPVAYFYNEALFEEIGIVPPDPAWDVDILAEQIRVLADDAQFSGGEFWAARLYGLYQSYFTGYLRTFDGELLNPEGTETLLESTEAYLTVEWLQTLQEAANALDFGPADGSREIDYLNGRVGVMNQTANWALAAVNAPTNITVRATVPPKGINDARGTQAWAEGLAISTMSSDPTKALEVIAYYTNAENGIAQAEMVGSPGARNDVWESAALNEIHPIFGEFVATFPEGPDSLRLPIHATASFNEFQSVLNENLARIWLGEYDVQEGLARADAQCQAVLDSVAR